MDVVLGQLSHVLPLLMGEEVRHIGLLEQGIANVLLIRPCQA